MPAARPGVAAAARPARVAAATLAVLLSLALPAAAVGVDDVELRLGLPASEEGRPVLDLTSGDPEVEVRARNTTTEARGVRLYTVAAEPTEDGSFALGGEQSASWLPLDEQVDLAGGETAVRYAQVAAGAVPEGATHVAVVIETGTDSTLVTRAARVIELGEHEAGGSPGRLIALAVGLLVAAVVAHAARARHDRDVGTASTGRTAPPDPSGSS